MNKNLIKNFAIESRKILIEDIKYKASLLGITENDIVKPKEDNVEDIDTFSIHGSKSFVYNEDIIKREKLVHEIENKGFDNVIEEVAFTWFNRLIAIRFMEVNNFLPTKTRVLSSEVPGKSEPDIVTEASYLDLDLSNDDNKKINELKENNDEELFEFLFIKQCNKLHEVLPGLFEKTEDYAELLFNIPFNKKNGVIEQLLEIPEEDFKHQVEIIGWLYQYYISDIKKEVKNKKIFFEKEGLPIATQLFTTDWIVKYMVDNSLGRYWLERNPDSSLKSFLEYYLQDDEEKSKENLENISIEEIKFFDPCMGSGHILVYAFDVFYQIYLELGYSSKQIPELILKNNIYGLDIDDRAYQLSYFAVMMKAREYDRTIFKKNIIPNVYSFKEGDYLSQEVIELIQEESIDLADKIMYLKESYNDAKLFGSLIQMEKMDLDNIIQKLNEILSYKIDLDKYSLQDSFKQNIISLINQTKLLTLEYDIVVTNPPYLNKKNDHNDTMKNFLKKNYKNYLEDLFSVFIYRNSMFCKTEGYFAFMTPKAWMFTESYEELRNFILNEKSIDSLILLEEKAFKEANVSICTFVLSNTISNSKSTYIDLRKFKGDMEYQKEKFLEVTKGDTDYIYKIDDSGFDLIPGHPISFWADESSINSFKNNSLGEMYDVVKGLDTGSNDRFVRYWFEVPFQNIDFNKGSDNHQSFNLKWYPLNKGGQIRKWYGNHELVINWHNEGDEIKKYHKSHLRNAFLYFVPSVSWTISSGENFSFRYYPKGFIFNSASGSIFSKEDKEYILALLNSSVSLKILNVLSLNTSTTVTEISKIPIIKNDDYKKEITSYVKENIELCKNDFDDYETSRNFKSNPLIRYKSNIISDSFDTWQKHKQDDFDHLKLNEVRLNEIFSEIYSMDVKCDIEDEDVSINKANIENDIKDLILYAVGCMFGRYSLDDDGLICAGEEFDMKNYSTFLPEKDAILPILDTDYFGEKDIVNRFKDFIEVAFGSDHLDENLEFIANALDKDGETNLERIRNYFLDDFYEYHCDKYKIHRLYKSPIYWQFDSGKENAFKCLIYIQRYDSNTVARIRTDYLHKTQKAIEQNIEMCNYKIKNNSSEKENKNLKDEKKQLINQLEKTRIYDEALAYIANQRIDLDLDEGIVENYKKFQNVPIESEIETTKTIDLLTKI